MQDAEIGRTPQGVRGLKRPAAGQDGDGEESHSARSAWIETDVELEKKSHGTVALRKECVD